MITGLEPLVIPAISKAAATGAARLGAWGGRSVLERRKQDRVTALLDEQSNRIRLNYSGEYAENNPVLVVEFVSSPEVERCAIALAQAYLLELSSKKVDRLLETARTEFVAAYVLALGSSAPNELADRLFDSLQQAVAIAVTDIGMSAKLAPELQASFVKTAASLAISMAKNTELLETIDNLKQIHKFNDEYRAQVSSLHGTMRLPHAGTTRQVPYAQLFVQPRLSLSETSPDSGKPLDIGSSDRLLSCSIRSVVLGDPGGGKSTLSAKLVSDIAAKNVPELVNKVPFLVVLRDYATVIKGPQRLSLAEYITNICKQPFNVVPPENAIEYDLANNRAVVIFDGLDELLDTSLRRDVIQAVEGFAHRYPTCPIIVTSRRVGYEDAPLDSDLFLTVQLGEFDRNQVKEYVRKWFLLDESISNAQKDRLTAAFYADSTFVADLRTNPLMLSLMCGIYASENYIPRNRPDVYEKCALLLFERWDKQRGIEASLPFDAHVQAAMRSLALYMFTEQENEGMPREKLVKYITSYLLRKRFDDDESAETAATEFIEFCKGRAWVLTDIGSDIYGFTHRTFLEYFAGSQLVRTNNSAKELFSVLRRHLGNASWDVVAQLAVQILGKNVEDGADDFLQMVVDEALTNPEDEVSLVSFAARTLEFVVPRPSIIRQITALAVACFKSSNARPIADIANPVMGLLDCSAENLPRVASVLTDEFETRLADDRTREVCMFLMFRLPLNFGVRKPENIKFWVGQARILYKQFRPIVHEESFRKYWIGILEFEQCDLPAQDLLQRFGVDCLYRYRVLSDRSKAPFVYRYMMTRPGDAMAGIWEVVGRSSVRRLKGYLLDAIVAREAPWITYQQDYINTCLALNVNEKVNGGIDVLDLLFALPLIEIKLNVAKDDEPNNSNWHILFRQLSSIRRGGSRGKVIQRRIERICKGRPQALKLVDAWLLGEVNLVKYRRRAARR